VKVFVIPVPPAPEKHTAHPDLPAKYKTPVALTHNGAASGIQTLSNGRLIFTRSSFTSPNDVFVIHGLQHLEDEIEAENEKPVEFSGRIVQVTRFTEDVLKEKHLGEAEAFWFKGANDKDVQGWALKPKGFRAGVKSRWPVVLLIHGGVRWSASKTSLI
jgi:dipeptidyl aminopeptidase/acylaminoacyl peptidase